MSNMEILSHNYIDTTGMMYISWGGISTATQPSDLFKLIDRDPTNQFLNDVTASAFYIFEFNKTATVNRVAVQNIDVKQLRIYYSNANFTSTTIGSSFRYLNENGVTVASISILATSTVDDNIYLKIDRDLSIKSMVFHLDTDKVTGIQAPTNVGQIYIGKSLFEFPYNPSVKNYKPNVSQNKFEHKMADGGNRVYVTDSNFDTSIKIKYLSKTERDTLFDDVYNNYRDFVLMPEPITGTITRTNVEEWNGEMYAVNWVGSFGRDFADNYKENGYNVDMKFKELSK